MSTSGFSYEDPRGPQFPLLEIPWIKASPGSKLAYTLNWGDPRLGPWLTGAEKISAPAPVWTLAAGLTLLDQSQTDTTTTAKIEVGVVAVGTTLRASCRITTDAGQVETRSFDLVVTER